MSKNLKDKLLQQVDPKYIKEVDCSDIYGDSTDIFYIASIPVGQFEKYQARTLKSVKKEDIEGIKAMLLAMTLCDENGTKMFDYTNPKDVAACASIHTPLATRLYAEAQKFNLATTEDMESKIKNSKSDQTEGSFLSLQ